MALPGYDSLVAIMKLTDPISHSDGTFLVLYEDAPIKGTPRNTIQNIIDTQVRSASLLQKNPLPLAKDPCIVEAYTGSDDCHL